ncbi:ROK family protein [Fodinicola feengrottensis]|uniref:ROK family protein n=1 Tax=Fodinicola feengrottensis TaxID=435914 RepID=UPI0013D35196
MGRASGCRPGDRRPVAPRRGRNGRRNRLFERTGRAGRGGAGRIWVGAAGKPGRCGRHHRGGRQPAAARRPAGRPAGAEETDATAVFAAARAGDEAAAQAIDEVAARLARGLSALLLVLDPEMVVLGGGVSTAGPSLLSAIERHIEPLALAKPLLTLSALGDEATAPLSVPSVLPSPTWKTDCSRLPPIRWPADRVRPFPERRRPSLDAHPPVRQGDP